MSSTFSTITFYVAPSKEHHPLVRQLFLWIDTQRDGKPRKVEKVTRVEGFLTGKFEICDGNRFEDEFNPEWVGGYPPGHPEIESQRQMYEKEKSFFDFYRELGSLGYISEDHRESWWSSNGDGGSEWYDRVSENAYKIGTSDEHRFKDYFSDPESESRAYNKRKLQEFWDRFPNLMHFLKYDRAPEQQPQTLGLTAVYK